MTPPSPHLTSQAAGIALCAVGSFIVTVWGVTADETEGASNLVLGEPPPPRLRFWLSTTPTLPLLHPIVGNIILIIQCLSMAGLLVIQKPVLERLPPTTITAGYYTVATFLTALVTFSSLHEGSEYTIDSSEGWAAVVYGEKSHFKAPRAHRHRRHRHYRLSHPHRTPSTLSFHPS